MQPALATQIELLERTPDTLTGLVADQGDAALDFHPTPTDWSIREILAHLVDDESYVMRLRLERLVKEDHPRLTEHNEQHWFAQRNTTRDAADLLLSDFRLQRAASIQLLRSLRPVDWERSGYQPEYGVLTVANWLDRWVDHDQTHLQQIIGLKRAFSK